MKGRFGGKFSFWAGVAFWCVQLALPAHALGGEIEDALRMIDTTPAGKAILERAKQRWDATTTQGLLHVFKWSSVSRTDAVLTRHFDPKSGRETRERVVTVYLRQGQPIEDLVLDISHELTHATAPVEWDPYDPELTPGKYIWNAIEGPGGEVDAMTNECNVALQLGFEQSSSAERCKRYLSSSLAATLDPGKIRAEFYRVGPWYRELVNRLGPEAKSLPLLSDAAPQLLSSTGKAPYPVSLLREFDEITEIACRNSRKRLAASVSVSTSLGARPREASATDRAPASSDRDSQRFVQKRCGAAR